MKHVLKDKNSILTFEVVDRDKYKSSIFNKRALLLDDEEDKIVRVTIPDSIIGDVVYPGEIFYQSLQAARITWKSWLDRGYEASTLKD